MTKRQAKRIALGYMAAIALQDDGRILEGEGYEELNLSDDDKERLKEAVGLVAFELFGRSGTSESINTNDIIREVLFEEARDDAR